MNIFLSDMVSNVRVLATAALFAAGAYSRAISLNVSLGLQLDVHTWRR